MEVAFLGEKKETRIWLNENLQGMVHVFIQFGKITGKSDLDGVKKTYSQCRWMKDMDDDFPFQLDDF